MEKRTIDVYHTGFLELKEPDVRYGRKNADFGQGFYVTPDEEFASRWAKQMRDQHPIMNCYRLNMAGLKVHVFTRSLEWFKYIFRNRRGQADELDADLVIGPIANDTIYDTLGIFTSGFISDEQALKLLMEGPEYMQIALKSERAAEQLTWQAAREISDAEVIKNQALLKAEQDEYLTLISKKMAEEE